MLRVTLSHNDRDIESCETDWSQLDDDIFHLVRREARELTVSDAELEHMLDSAIQLLRDEYDPRWHSVASVGGWSGYVLELGPC